MLTKVTGANLDSVGMAAARARDAIRYRDEQIAEMVHFKTASLRQIAEATGLTHAAVAKIAKRVLED